MPSPRKDLGQLGRDHRKKHFMGVISGALINERLDRAVSAANQRLESADLINAMLW